MTKRLYRSRTDKMIGGVAGGLGNYLNIDPVLVRIIFALTFFLNGAGFLLYIILWIVVPQEEPELYENGFVETNDNLPDTEEAKYAELHQNVSSQGSGRVIAGLLLIGIGIVFLIDRFFPHFDFGDILPFLIIVLGLALILNSAKKTK